MTTKEIIAVEKEVYDAVLRNSVRVNNLEKENQQLKELLKECKEKLKYCVRETYELQTKIDNAIGEK